MSKKPLSVLVEEEYLYLLDAISYHGEHKNRSEAIRAVIRSEACLIDDPGVKQILINIAKGLPPKKKRVYKSGFVPYDEQQ